LGLLATPEATLTQVRGVHSVWLAGPADPLLAEATTTLTGHGFRVTQTLPLSGVTLIHLVDTP
jgi:hypothetical protein